MNWFNQDILYSIPDEIGSFADCSWTSSVIQSLSKQYSHDNFKHIPHTLTILITTYINDLFGCISEFETKYRKLRYEFKSKMYSFFSLEGVECFYEAYDKGDNTCLHVFLMQTTKHELRYINHDGEAF